MNWRRYVCSVKHLVIFPHVFFVLRLNKQLSKQSWGWWFETLSRPLWRQCNVMTQSCGRLFIQLQWSNHQVYERCPGQHTTVYVCILHKIWNIWKAQKKHPYLTISLAANGLAPTTNKYCDFNVTLRCSVMDEKCNLQCPTYYKRHFEMHSLGRKTLPFLFFYSNFVEDC